MSLVVVSENMAQENRIDLDLDDLKSLQDLEKLMKHRYKSSTKPEIIDAETKFVISRSNQLLRTNLVSLLLKSIIKDVSGITGRIESIKVIGKIKAKAYVVFFCLYQTQAEIKVSEYRAKYFIDFIAVACRKWWNWQLQSNT